MAHANYCLDHNIKFSSEYQYVLHQLSCNYLTQPFVCNLLNSNGSMCGEPCKNGSTLALHASDVHSLYVCSECEYVSSNQIGLKYHEHIGLPGSRLRKYNYAHIVYIYTCIYILSMFSGPYKCTKCVKTFSSTKALNMHVYYHAMREAEWDAVRTGEDLFTFENAHIPAVVSKQKSITNFTCYLCTHLNFGRLRDLRKHFAKKHVLPPYEANAKKYFKQLYNIAKLKNSYGLQKHKR